MCRHFRITNWLIALGTFGFGVLISSPFTAETVPSSEVVKVIQTVNENIAVPLASKTCVPPAPRTFCLLTEESSVLVDEARQLEKRLVKVRNRSGVYAGSSEKKLVSLQHELEDKLQVLRERGRKLAERYVMRQQQFDETAKEDICNEN